MLTVRGFFISRPDRLATAKGNGAMSERVTEVPGHEAAASPAAAITTPIAEPSGAPLPFRYGADIAAEIEQRWQDRWAADGTCSSPNPAGSLASGFESVAGRPKRYVLDMFPYPSGIGIHVGHPIGYI